MEPLPNIVPGTAFKIKIIKVLLETAATNLQADNSIIFRIPVAPRQQKQEIAATLQSIDFFSTLDTFSFERLASFFSKKFWRRNEQLLVEGTPAKELHVVQQGGERPKVS